MDLGIDRCDPLPMAKKATKPRKHDVPRKPVKALRAGVREQAAQKARRTFEPLHWKAWFKECGVTQRNVADVIGELEAHVSNIHKGRREYLRSQLEDMAAYLTTKTGRTIEPWMLLLPPNDPILSILATVHSIRGKAAA